MKMENNNGDNTLPSLRPVFTLNSSVTPVGKRKVNELFSNKECSALPNRELSPSAANFLNIKDLSTDGKADLKSINAANMTP
jgi:hypothetical protein